MGLLRAFGDVGLVLGFDRPRECICLGRSAVPVGECGTA